MRRSAGCQGWWLQVSWPMVHEVVALDFNLGGVKFKFKLKLLVGVGLEGWLEKKMFWHWIEIEI